MVKDKINILELLKNCPKGMELDCAMYDDLEFDSIVDMNDDYLPIRCRRKNSDDKYNFYNFTKYGCWDNDYKAKCVIFPKGKTTWEGFQQPFKDGDIVYTDYGSIAILKITTNLYHSSYCGLFSNVFKITNVTLSPVRLATEEEKQKLFDAIKSNGYKWNEETKTLVKFIEPKFKVGDRIRKKDSNEDVGLITDIDITDNYYVVETKCGVEVTISISIQNNYELVPNKFDITTLKPFESKVLVRDENKHEWRGQFFSHYHDNSDRPYVCIGVEGLCEYKQCVPYEGNEHLIGDTGDCDEYYKTWVE